MDSSSNQVPSPRAPTSSSGKRHVGAGGASSGGDEEEDEEDSDSSSSTLTPRSGSPEAREEDLLEEFRQQWKNEVLSKASSSSAGDERATKGGGRNRHEEDTASKSKKHDGENSLFFKARSLFLEGVELEQDGQHFLAIQKYKRAVQLVPDIEFKTFDYNRLQQHKQQHREKATALSNATESDPNGNDSELVSVEDEECGIDLALHFSNMQLRSKLLCEPETYSSSTHISALPVELLINILKWVVSKDLDVRALERCSQVCRGFFLASRSSDLWRLICLNTWGLNNLPLSSSCWRSYFLSRPRVLLHGCYIASMTYVREGERGFQDNEFHRSWHMVKYYRFLRFFSGGRITMLTSAEEPAEAIKLIGGMFGSRLHGAVSGHYRMSGHNTIACVLKKPILIEQSKYKRRAGRKNDVNIDMPDQEFHFELELRGKRFNQLQWLRYHVINLYKNGSQQRSEIDVSSSINFPPLYFSRVQSYTTYAEAPLN